MVKATGIAATGDTPADCSCCGCSDCPDSTPATWTCTLSAFLMAVGCWQVGIGANAIWDMGATINQTVTLAHPSGGSACQWRGTITAGVEQYNSPICDPAFPHGPVTYTYDVVLQFSAGTYTITVSGPGLDFVTSISSTDCNVSLTFPGPFTDMSAQVPPGATGGAAALTPHP